MSEYSGTIVKIDASQNYAFIDKRTAITLATGERRRFKYDVFVRTADLGFRPMPNQKIFFDVEKDPRRLGGFRAINVVRDVLPIENGVDLHIDDPGINHPSVAVRWCVQPEALEYMRTHLDGVWALIIVAQERQHASGNDVWFNPRKTVVMTVNGADAIGNHRGYLPFKAAGDYDVVSYLIHSRRTRNQFWSLLKTLRERYSLGIDVWDGAHEYLVTNADKLYEGFEKDYDTVVAYHHLRVRVPADVFAKPLPGWARTWLSYFNLGRPVDECAMRGRMVAAFTLGPFLYLFLETWKRTWLLALGFLHILFGGSPLPCWKMGVLPAFNAPLRVVAVDEFELLGYARDRFYLMPAIPISLIGVVYLGTWLWRFEDFRYSFVIIVVILIGAFIYGLGSAGFVLWRQSLNKPSAKKALEKIETYAVCRTEQPASGPVSIKLIWTGFKNSVCRSYPVG